MIRRCGNTAGVAWRNDRGSMLPLLLVYVLVALVVMYIATLSASAYLTRKQLYSIADAAAVAAANAYDLAHAQIDENGRPHVQLDEQTAVQTAQHFVAQLNNADVRVVNVAVAGDQVRVTMSCRWDLPLAEGVLPHAFDIEVTAAARVQFQ